MVERQKISSSTILFWIGVVMILVMGGFLGLSWNQLPPQLPWFYSLPWGEKQLVDKMWFVYIFGGMMVFLILTRVLAKWAGKGDTTVQNTVMIGVTITVTLMAASFFRVMFIFLSI